MDRELLDILGLGMSLPQKHIRPASTAAPTTAKVNPAPAAFSRSFCPYVHVSQHGLTANLGALSRLPVRLVTPIFSHLRQEPHGRRPIQAYGRLLL